jgi:hypothetical protein
MARRRLGVPAANVSSISVPFEFSGEFSGKFPN